MEILVLFYIFLTLYSIKSLLKKEDESYYNKIKEEIQDPTKLAIYTIIVIFFGLLITTPLIILYVNASKYTELLAWLSAAQILIAIKHFIDAIVMMGKVATGTYKLKNRIYKLLMVSFDVFYIVLVLQYLLKQ